MNASPFPQNLCSPPGNRPGLLRFVAEPPGALYTHQVASFRDMKTPFQHELRLTYCRASSDRLLGVPAM